MSFCHALLCVFNLCHDYSSPLGGGQVVFMEIFVSRIVFEIAEYIRYIIYNYVFVGFLYLNHQLY